MNKHLYILVVGIFISVSLNSQQITEIEYFLNSDPGLGNATQVSFTSDTTVETSFTVDISSLNFGINNLFVRAKDNFGNWGHYTKKTFYHVPGTFTDPNLNEIEYFFDVDPGFGNGETVYNTPDSVVNISFIADLSFLSPGMHNLFIRTKDEFDRWSLYTKKSFYLIEGSATNPDIVNIEYFYDEDPGFGNGIPVPITDYNDTIEMAFDLQTTGLTLGMHYLYIRAKDAKDRWSLYAYDSISIDNIAYGIELKTFLEGSFDGISSMNTYLNTSDKIPLSQPFLGPPWNYSGTENITLIPNSNIVDWVLIEVRDAASASNATSGTMLERQAAFILNDGSIVGLDGASNLLLNSTFTNQLFIVIHHRNHLSIMSANPLTETGGIYDYDFTDNANKAYGGTDAQTEVATGVWGMISGDANGDGTIDNDDYNVWKTDAGKNGYNATDFNLNGETDNVDKNDLWFENINMNSYVPD